MHGGGGHSRRLSAATREILYSRSFLARRIYLDDAHVFSRGFSLVSDAERFRSPTNIARRRRRRALFHRRDYARRARARMTSPLFLRDHAPPHRSHRAAHSWSTATAGGNSKHLSHNGDAPSLAHTTIQLTAVSTGLHDPCCRRSNASHSENC